ncbi:cytochrome b/b6 domain-containing protein [Acidisoma sp.]|uniref:cytochrome b/b6 domain-containing protein n=1 Tax=Acidisoma sp. TaxID=1872115 RepID=UPI003B003543
MNTSKAQGLPRQRWVTVHPLLVRITHWVNAVALVCMVMSGWEIYNASPLLPFVFPPWMTLGGWLAGGIAWHFAAMWLLVVNGLVYVAYGIVGRHFRRSFFPLSARSVWTDFRGALSFRLYHTPGVYNAVQKLLYIAVLLVGLLAVLSGLAMWKPVQLWWLTAALGSYPSVRWIHFLAMTGIVGFVVIHLVLVAVVPRTLPTMITGRAHVPAAVEAHPDA